MLQYFSVVQQILSRITALLNVNAFLKTLFDELLKYIFYRNVS
jgi:hypothetical protein